jgi:1-deoxy-D-xylulose-5-phosphate reductoisomerase
MKGPIAYALSYPDRLAKASVPIDWSASSTWSFAPIDTVKFPAVDLARRCGSLGGGLPAIFNAANEVAVAEFLENRIAFLDIPLLIEIAVENTPGQRIDTIEDVEAVDRNARALTLSACARQSKSQSGGARA